MSIITLLTDFGIVDEYVGVMKGVILSINSSATIIDITHHINPQDLIQAAYLIESAYKYFPEGTVHVVVVDPGVGSDRAIFAMRSGGHLFLAPDNGVLTLLIEKGEIEAVVRIENPNYFLNNVSRTFHGRDVFAPVSAHLSLGAEMKHFGTLLDSKNLVRLSIQKPFISKQGELFGTVVSVDHFGNLITNIDSNSLGSLLTATSEKNVVIRIGKDKIRGISSSYNSVSAGDSLAIVGSRGYLEIAVNGGSAKGRYKAQKGDSIRISLGD